MVYCRKEGCLEEAWTDDGYCSEVCAGGPPTLPQVAVLGVEPDTFPEPDAFASTPTPMRAAEPAFPKLTFTEADARAFLDEEFLLRNEPVLPTDAEERKNTPIFSGVLQYFPLAVAAVARLSKRGNDKHNPGEKMHWARDKSMDHEDCIARHLLDIDTVNLDTGEYDDAVALAWRALAKLQLLEEDRLGKPYSRGSR